MVIPEDLIEFKFFNKIFILNLIVFEKERLNIFCIYGDF